MKVNVDDLSVTLIVEYEGQMHLVSMEREKYDAISLLVQRSIHKLHKTNKNINELRMFLGLDKQ